MQKIFLNFLISGLLLTSIFSCSSNQANQATHSALSTNNQPTETTVLKINDRTDKIKFKTEGGSDLFSLKQLPDGAKLVNANEQEIARIKTDEAGKIKIKNIQDKVLGYVLTSHGYWTIENPEKQSVYILKRNSDSNYQLEDVNKKKIYQIKTNKTGLDISTPDQKLVYQVRIKEGKISLRNTSGNTVFSTKSNISPLAFTCFGLDALTREQQAALAYAVNLTGG
ncbi:MULTISPECIES: hypothetical protein [unclassified Anabaena]|uniref:hypothetical protein n=1 Tax=unclassified Anabaena TaxID=2619674 RepID=UPI002B20EFF3|nr:hypothetical protein [Anabaena sp. UHCC 0399]MEA5568259.1 hypothetical protein [Anabaena sp. UHCC 0399]